MMKSMTHSNNDLLLSQDRRLVMVIVLVLNSLVTMDLNVFLLHSIVMELMTAGWSIRLPYSTVINQLKGWKWRGRMCSAYGSSTSSDEYGSSSGWTIPSERSIASSLSILFSFSWHARQWQSLLPISIGVSIGAQSVILLDVYNLLKEELELSLLTMPSKYTLPFPFLYLSLSRPSLSPLPFESLRQ